MGFVSLSKATPTFAEGRYPALVKGPDSNHDIHVGSKAFPSLSVIVEYLVMLHGDPHNLEDWKNPNNTMNVRSYIWFATLAVKREDYEPEEIIEMFETEGAPIKTKNMTGLNSLYSATRTHGALLQEQEEKQVQGIKWGHDLPTMTGAVVSVFIREEPHYDPTRQAMGETVMTAKYPQRLLNINNEVTRFPNFFNKPLEETELEDAF